MINSHRIAGLLITAILFIPIINNLAPTGPYLYFVVTCLLALSVIKTKYKLHIYQAIWSLLLLSFMGALLTTSLFSETYNYNFTIALFYLSSTLVLGLIVAVPRRLNFYYSYYLSYTSLCLFVTILLINAYLRGNQDYRAILNIDYLTLGSTLSIGYCLSLPFVFYNKGKLKYLCSFCTFVLFIGIATCLSRGALIFSTLISLCLIACYWPSKVKNIFLAVFTRLAVFSAVLSITAIVIPLRTVTRINRLASGTEAIEGGRGDIWLKAIDMINQAPVIGHGLGKSLDTGYPHNLFLQVGIDGGIISILMLFIVVIFPPLFFIISRHNGIINFQPIAWGLLSAYIYLVLEYSKSGDFYKARTLIIIASLLISYIGMETLNSKRNMKIEPIYQPSKL